MTYVDPLSALRRDDLKVTRRHIDILDHVDDPWIRGDCWSEATVLVELQEGGHPFQAVQQMDDIDWEGDAVFVYVPLSFGPIARVS